MSGTADEVNTKGFEEEANYWRMCHPTDEHDFRMFLHHLGIDRNDYDMVWRNIPALVDLLRMNIAELKEAEDWGRLVALGDRWQLGPIVDQWAEHAIASAIDGGLPSHAARLAMSHRVSPATLAGAFAAYEADCTTRGMPTEFVTFCARTLSSAKGPFI